MTRIGTEASPSQPAQIQPRTVPNLRTLGDSGAGSFRALFAEKSENGVGEQAEARQRADEDVSRTNADADEPGAAGTDPDESSAEVNNPEGQTDDGAVSSGDAAAKATGVTDESHTPDAAGGGAETTASGDARPLGVTQASIDSAVAGQGAPITEQDQVRRELKHAASVDLASLAKQEQLGRSRDTADERGSTTNQGTQDASADPRPAVAPPRAERGGVNGQAGGLAASDQGGPPPGLQPPQFQPERGAGQGAAEHTPGKSPYTGDHPISAGNQARGAGDGGPRESDASLRAEAASAKAAFLDRLASSGAARRGAVSAVERVVVGDRVAIGADTKLNPQRPISFKPVDPPAPTRDAFLAPVQKGLGKMLAEGGGKLTVLLRPQELGDVRIAMETRRGSVRVKMEASSDAARKVLESGLDALRATLESRGVKVEGMDVTTAARQEPSFENRGGGDAGSGAGSRGDGGEAQQDRSGHAHQNARQQHWSEGGSRSSDGLNGREGENDQGGLNAEQSRRLWTELGIDAVA